MTVATRELAYDRPPAPVARARNVPPWAAIVGFAIATALLLAVKQPALMRLAFPAGAVAVAGWLYLKGPGHYLAFAWLLWHFSPGIRRMVDYQLGGMDPANPISLTPLVVSAIAALGVLRRLPELWSPRMVPWLVAIGCILYGYFVGVLRVGIMPATHALLTWVIPIGLGLFHMVQWRRYPEAREATRVTFLIAGSILAAYGIIQYLDPPEWDRLWMSNSGMYSIGRAFPYEVRVFGLMNSPHSFATILLAGFFIGLVLGGRVRILTLGLGAIALLLSLVRSVWLAAALGLVVLAVSVPRRMAKRLMLTGLVTAVAVAVAPLLAPTSISKPTIEILTTRFLSFANLERDVSFRDRASFLDHISEVVAANPWGHGLGSTGVSSLLTGGGRGIRDFDNGVFAVLYALGWVAGAGLLLAAVAAVIQTFRRRPGPVDLMVSAGRAIVASVLVMSLGANVFEGATAAVFWCFAGLTAAGLRYAARVEAG